MLAAVKTKPAATTDGYARSRFGGWTTSKACDTRRRILRRDLAAVSVQAGSGGCTILKGRLTDPYTGKRITYAPRTASKIDVDHVVSLGDAWRTGARTWSAGRRRKFANDPLNLLTTTVPTNTAKGDHDAAGWLPPRRAAQCAFVARQVAVKQKYKLWVTAAERSAVTRVLATCPTQRPTGAKAATKPVDPKATVVAAKKKKKKKPPTRSQTDPRFATCKDANAAGYGDYRRGVDSEYDWYRDRDGDGVVCER